MKKHEAHNLICEALIDALNEEIQEGTDAQSIEYNRGFQYGLKAKTYGGKFIMDKEQLKSHYPPAFAKGYYKGLGEDWWSKFNDRLTSMAGRLGYSLTRR